MGYNKMYLIKYRLWKVNMYNNFHKLIPKYKKQQAKLKIRYKV